jgi:hypothetical protein
MTKHMLRLAPLLLLMLPPHLLPPAAAHLPPQAKAKIMVVRDIEREDIEFISKTLGCLPIAHIDHMKPEKLAHAELVEEVEVRVCVGSLGFRG